MRGRLRFATPTLDKTCSLFIIILKHMKYACLNSKETLKPFDRGFTMIELVFSIVIIGLLAAIALPRFFSWTNQATLNAHYKFAADFKAGINIAHTAWISAGMPNPGGNGTATVILDNRSISISANPSRGFGGWPYGWNNLANPYSPACVTTVNDILHNPPEIKTNSANCTQAVCYVAVASYDTVWPFGPVCTFTLNGTSNTIVYKTSSGSVIAQ